jgi:hypothetical protein
VFDIGETIDAVTSLRSGFRAVQNRVEHALAVTSVYDEKGADG